MAHKREPAWDRSFHPAGVRLNLRRESWQVYYGLCADFTFQDGYISFNNIEVHRPLQLQSFLEFKSFV